MRPGKPGCGEGADRGTRRHARIGVEIGPALEDDRTVSARVQGNPMNAKLLMMTSSAILAVGGLTALFAPHELAAALGAPIAGSGVPIQLLGSAYFASAIANWTGKDKPIGGIYSRPLSLGNFVHFSIGALVLLNGAVDGSASAALVTACAVYAALAAAFARLAFGGSAAAAGAGADR